MSEIDVKNIKIKGIKSKLQKEYYKAFSKLQKDPATIDEYADMEDKMILETTGLTQDQIDDLFIEDKGILMGRILENFTKGTVFQKTSMTQPNSSTTDTPKS